MALAIAPVAPQAWIADLKPAEMTASPEDAVWMGLASAKRALPGPTAPLKRAPRAVVAQEPVSTVYVSALRSWRDPTAASLSV